MCKFLFPFLRREKYSSGKDFVKTDKKKKVVALYCFCKMTRFPLQWFKNKEILLKNVNATRKYILNTIGLTKSQTKKKQCPGKIRTLLGMLQVWTRLKDIRQSGWQWWRCPWESPEWQNLIVSTLFREMGLRKCCKDHCIKEKKNSLISLFLMRLVLWCSPANC